MQHFALNIDEFSERVFDHLERGQDGGAGHFARFTAETREAAIERVTACLRKLVGQRIYESDEYGHPLD